MKKDVKLYNMILPPFMLFFFVPALWIVSALGNFIIDSIVLLIISIFKSKNKNTAKQNTTDNKQNSVDAVITGMVGCKIYSRKNLFSDIVALVIFRT